MPRRGAYGSVEQDDTPLIASASRASVRRAGVTPDASVEYGTNNTNPFYNAAGNAVPSSAAGARPSWWRAGIVIAAAATALSAVFGLVHLASFSGIAQRPVSANDFAEVGPGGDEVVTAPDSGNVHKIDITYGEKPSSATANEPNMQEELLADRQQRASQQQRPDTAVHGAELGQLTFMALNDYTRRGDEVGVGYPWLEGKILVEPYRETSLEVIEPVEGMSYYWSIVETRNSEEGLGEFVGDRVTVQFKTAPEYTVVLLEMDERNQASRMVTVNIFCKYVRREIRTLFDDERDEMFDAMKVLWDVRIDEGQALYGKNYVDVWTIDEFHQIGASDLVCDHLHDGIGFGITHSMVTLMFEASLQLVNPKLSLPYWDFTIDGYLVDTLYDGDYSHLRDVSDLWTPEWFGSVNPADYQVKDGRWGNLSVPIVSEEERDILGADVYGRMRSPWNVNDREYLSRGLGEMCGDDATDFYDWPTCQTHYEMQAMYTSYYGYTWHSQYGPHGPTHIWIGGNFDCKKNMEVVEDILGDDNILHLTAFAFIERKDLFRLGLFKCRGLAEATMPAKEVMDEGMCGCLDLDLDKTEDYQLIFDIFASGYDFGEVNENDKKVLATQYCNGVIGIGESSQSSSPLDPTFWSLHPTMERLLMFKRMTGTMTDLSWPDEVGTWVGEDGTEYDVVISTESDTCMGHRGSDVFPYGILDDTMSPQFTFWGKTGTNTINNRDMVHLFDPRVNALSYIYDSYSWDHCTEAGWDMNDLFTESAAHQGRTSPTGETLPNVDGYGVFRKGESLKPLYETTNPRKTQKEQTQ